MERGLGTENERATGAKVTAKIKEIGSRPGGRLRDDAFILQAVRAVDSHLGIRLPDLRNRHGDVEIVRPRLLDQHVQVG